MKNGEIEIRRLETVEHFRRCIELQREAFALPELEISPLRHFVVSNNCGGFTLGAFAGARLIGFVHHLLALRNNELIGYSHMTAISAEFQNAGIGAKLKWAQRETALISGQKFIKWTFDPMQARNAHFNLNRLGVTISSYAANYYGSNYLTMELKSNEPTGLDSDRLFAEWRLDSPRVASLANGETNVISEKIARRVEIVSDWKTLVETAAAQARAEQTRVRAEFQNAFAAKLICAGFERGAEKSSYLFYEFV